MLPPTSGTRARIRPYSDAVGNLSNDLHVKAVGRYEVEKSGRSRRDGSARVAAYQVYAVHRALADEDRRHLAAGTTARERYPSAVKAADHAFALLRDGLAATTASPLPPSCTVLAAMSKDPCSPAREK